MYKILCEYGCGKEAKFTLKNGKHCCSEHYNKCDAIRIKNSEGLKKAYKEGKKLSSYKLDKETNLRNLKKGSDVNKQRRFEQAPLEFRKNHYKNTTWLKNHMIDCFHVEYKCSCCGISDWRGEPLSLEVHHIDGDNSNNEINNLTFLCPNCHSITSNLEVGTKTQVKKEFQIKSY